MLQAGLVILILTTDTQLSMLALAVLSRQAWRRTGAMLSAEAASSFEVMSWNVAAINTNPWEYYIDREPAYVKLMTDIQELMTTGGDLDAPVSTVFSDEMANTLFERMLGCGYEFEAVEATRCEWETSFKHRLMIRDFVANSELGAKRLISMADRVTNTLGDGRLRPCAINFYAAGRVSSVAKWWPQWLEFMFDDGVCTRLKKISRAKYPALTSVEEAMSLPLQTLCLALFDCVLIVSLNALCPEWPHLKERISKEMSPAAKTRKTIELLHTRMSRGVAAIFLQEVGPDLAGFLRHRLPIPYALAAAPNTDQSPQASAIIVDSNTFPGPYLPIQGNHLPAGLAVGDLEVVQSANGYVLASFHGDTNGLMTLPVVTSVAAAAANARLIFGLDANAFAADRASPGLKLASTEFTRKLTELGLASCFADDPPPITTFNARTFLQPQLQKAVKYDDRFTSKLTDRNPKDYIVFSVDHFGCSPLNTKVDNTGRYAFEDQPFPTYAFPSDHAIISTTLCPRECDTL